MKKSQRHRVAFFKRTLSMLLAVILLISNYGVAGTLAGTATGESTLIDFSGYQSDGLDIYNYLYYTSANGALEYSSGSYKIIGENRSQGIVIGNHPRETVAGEKNNTEPLNTDITAALSELIMTNTMTVKPVGESNAQKVVLTVDKSSSIGALVVEDNANLELTLDADITVGSITLGQNSTLTVKGSKTLTVLGSFTGQGTVALNGGVIQANEGISSANLSLNRTRVNASNASVCATESLTMESSTVEDASLFGYDAEGAAKVLTLTGNNAFSNVTAVGCTKNSAAIVSLEGIDTVSSSSGTTYYCDYIIQYQAEIGALTPQTDWPTAYRVSTGSADLSNAAVQGYHTAAGFTAGTSVPLPTDSMQSGYVHKGWKLNDTEETVSAITSAKGNVTLTAILEKGTVFVKLDIGFNPTQYTNDTTAEGTLPERNSTIISSVDSVASLPVPSRFGYKFSGWRITSGTNKRDIPYHEGTEIPYTVELNDCIYEDKNSIVTMEAVWVEDNFPITLFLGSDVRVDDNLLISVDGGTTFQKYKDLGTTGTGATADVEVIGRTIQFSSGHGITYGQTISDYLRGIFTDLPAGTLPILKDSSEAGTAQTFAGWSNVSGAIDGSSRFLYGEGGMLTPGDKKLTEYQQSLHQNTAAVQAVWGVMSYALTLPDTMPTGWTLVYTDSADNEHTIKAGETAGKIQIPQYSKVTLYTSSTKPENFSLWGFEGGGNKIMPTEQEFHSGDANLNYQFEMPAANVTATYNKGKEIWINIAKSPIRFEKNVSNNNRTVNGFWYADEIDGMTPLFEKTDKTLNGTDISGTALTEGTYFYQWTFADKLCVTSDGKKTQNQLTLVDALTGGVYFKDVYLAMRDAYINNANGSFIDGVDCESSVQPNGLSAAKVESDLASNNVNLADCANIVIDNHTQQAYTTKLFFKGHNNTIGAIMQETLKATDVDKNMLTLQGDSRTASTVNLGTAFGNFSYTIRNIKIIEYKKEDASKTDFNYLIYSFYQAGVQCTYSDIKAPNKYMHAGSLTNGNELANFENSSAELYSVCVYRGLEVKNSYVRIHENVRLGTIPLYLARNAKLVVDGNVEMNYHHWADADSIVNRGVTDDTDNWLVVKGNYCDLANRTWRSGTLICNTLVFGRTGGIRGGTVITNQIINQSVGFWSYNKNTHKYEYDRVGNRQTTLANQNYDFYPFVIYHHYSGQPNTYTFSGGKIYLLGYYKTQNDPLNAGKQMYDPAVKATDGENPVAAFMNPLLDSATGDLIANPAVNTAEVQAAVESSSRTNNECVVMGNSSTYYSQRRSVEISGNVEIYAAGNMTFFNDTIVSGGTIRCNGSFGSKGDLTINNGNITATVVGNAYNLTTTMEDGTIRWKHADIRGGTVTADRIGPYEKRVSDSAVPADVTQRPKSSVTIGNNATIVGTPYIHHDVYINYIFDSALFNNNGTPKNQNNLCFDTDWEQGKTFENQSWVNDELQFTPPNILDASGGTGNWNWDDLNGNKVTSVSDKGIPQNEDGALTGDITAYNRIQMKLYAVKDSYNLIFKAGADKIQSLVCNGNPVTPTQNSDGVTIASAPSGKDVVLELNDATMAQDYSVLWYIDGSGVIHNVMPTKVEKGKIYFKMPSADVEVYISRDMTLDLDKASYTLLQGGFRTEANAAPERTDSLFHYLGNLVIHQGSITEDISFNIDTFGEYQMSAPKHGGETKNRILVDKDFNSKTNNRTVTLRRIYQNGTPTSYGIELQDGAYANFLLDGAIRTCRVLVPENASIVFDGVHDDRTKDALYPFVNGEALSNHNWASIGNWDGAAGNITLQDLSILGRSQGMYGSLCYSRTLKNNTVKYINCLYKSAQDGTASRGWYNRSYFACNAGTVIFDKCNFTLRVSRDWPGYFCDGSRDVCIRNNSTITVTHNGATETDPSQTFYCKIKNKLEIVDSTLSLSLRDPDDSKTYRIRMNVNNIPAIELKGNANLVLEQHARLKTLVIGDNSTVKSGADGTGYLLCENIEVKNNASLKAGGIIVSGFYDAKEGAWNELQTEDDFRAAMENGTRSVLDGTNYKGLEVKNNGTVTAGEYITGDVNGKIAVSGGNVTAPVIGTTGNIYGYTQYVPRGSEGEAYIYKYEKIPVGMNIDITGGQVNVGEYMGGMHTAVNIGGGEVVLAENAIIGLTPQQRTILYDDAKANSREPSNFGSVAVSRGTVSGSKGSISVPYGTVHISGAETGVNVRDMTADCGDITITGITGKYYDNIYTGSDRIAGHDRLGVYVENLLSAQNLTITGQSVVYADQAYIDVPSGAEGNFTVTTYGFDKSYLYTSGSYGVKGLGVTDYDYDDGIDIKTKNVFGTKLVNVHYIVKQQNVILDDDVAHIANPNTDPENGLPNYVVSTDSTDARYYTLKDASCSGYKFLGWYECDPVTNEFLNDTRINRIDRSNSKDLYLAAKWEKVNVTFEIRIRLADESEANPDTMEKVPGEDGVWRFKTTATARYGDQILTQSGVYLPNYTTNTLGILEVEYNNTIIQKDDKVTAQMADSFVNNGGTTPLVLMVTDHGTQVEHILITLDQNKNSKGRPEETNFNLSDGAVNSGSNTSNRVSVYESITATLGDIHPFANSAQANGLIRPTAPGYVFKGWFTNAECTPANEVNKDATLKSLYDAHTTTLYAKWEPNTYIVRFSAATSATDTDFRDNRWVTADKTVPTVDQQTNATLDYYWVYDTTPNEKDDNFWIKGPSGEQNYKNVLPSPWREGYVFKEWRFIDREGVPHKISSTDELNKFVVKTLDESNYVGNPDFAAESPALTLYAVYESVTVTYDLKGGDWTATAPTATPEYGSALAGYSKESEITGITEGTDYTKFGVTTGADDSTRYCVVSTTSGYYGEHSDYVTGDYRDTLHRKGYTFSGWVKKGAAETDTYYGCTPRFDNLSLEAKWVPNVYDLTLHVKDETYSGYVSDFSNPTPATQEITGVTVGSPISTDKWPSKEVWYAYNKSDAGATDDTKHRFMLGATFAGLDPGDSGDSSQGSTYMKYAEAVTNMWNSKTIFDNGDVFFLPEDKDYKEDLELAGVTTTRPTMTTIPDYPTGSNIQMYSIYRERSLVFIEKYVDENSEVQSKVMYTHPWSVYTSYPHDTYPDDGIGNYNDLTTNRGYALIGWYVGSDAIDDSMKYPDNAAEFGDKIENWKNNATHNGYDINVYTAYVAQQTLDQVLPANDNPASDTVTRVHHTLPGSMREGKLNYELLNFPAGLNLVSKSDMQAHKYDLTWESSDGKTCNANNTVAIELKIESDSYSYTTDLTKAANKQLLGNGHYIGKDYKLTLTLYHSNVMTESHEYPFTIHYSFEKDIGGTNVLENQFIDDNIKVTLAPSRYNVEYQVDLPESDSKLEITQPDPAFDKVNENTYRRTDKQAYGSNLPAVDKLPTVKGYDWVGNWSYAGSDGTATPLTGLDLSAIAADSRKSELADGAVTVHAAYAAREYALAKDGTVPDGAWTIKYGNGAADNSTQTELGGTSADVKYHSTVTFTPKDDQQAAEYINLTFTDDTGTTTKRLDHYAKKQADGSYTFVMPAQDVRISYSRVMELYLDSGSIELFPNGFKQKDNPAFGDKLITWPGDYRILQSENNNADFHPTENVLKLSGDLTNCTDGTGAARKIELGRLNITGDNSIELVNRDADGNEVQTAVNLTQQGYIAAKNILVPDRTSLTLSLIEDENTDAGANISLTPNTDRAAIGATAADGVNGSITLNNVDVSMRLQAPSVSSGIGSGRQDSTKHCGAVMITDSSISVKETSSAETQYTGAWIGGAGVASVNVMNTIITNSEDSNNHRAKAINGNTVDLTNCNIGDAINTVKEPIYAMSALNIHNCNIYQNNNYNLSTVTDDNYGLSGVSMIGTADGGTTTIGSSVVKVEYGGNGKTAKLFTGKMVIEDPASDVTIDGTQIIEVSHGNITINSSEVIQSGEKHTSHNELNYLLLEERDYPANAPNVEIVGLGNNKTITVQQPAQPADASSAKDVTVGVLTVNNDAELVLDGNLIVTGNASVMNEKTLTVDGGSYGITYQNGLSGEGSYVQNDGNLTAQNDVVVKGNMALTNVAADCPGHKLGSNGGSAATSTTVTIDGGSITADTIGAVGAHNDTFTFVKLNNTPAINGTLVQDNYRLRYDVNGLNVELKDESNQPLPTVLRTQTAYAAGTAGDTTVLDSKPANPTGTDSGEFLCWYIPNEDGTERLGLVTATDALPQGLDNRVLLSSAIQSAGMSQPSEADATRTLTVTAWLNVSGDATISKGRVFEALENNNTHTEIMAKGAWTAKLVSNATFVAGRDYQVVFSNALPAGTDLTLTVITDSERKYYHYTLNEAKDSVNFSAFSEMGATAGTHPTFAESESEQEVFLLSADFAELPENAELLGGDVSFNLLYENDTDPKSLGSTSTVNYTVTPVVNGKLEVSDSTVTLTTQPSGDERCVGKSVYLVGTLMKESAGGQETVKMPLNAKAVLTKSGTQIDGLWLNGNTVAFDLGSYGGLSEVGYTFGLENLPEGEYSVEWKLRAGTVLNLQKGACSNTVTGNIRSAARIQPMLDATTNMETRVLATGAPHEISFNYRTNAAHFTVTVEKQTTLANFSVIADSVKTVTTTLNAGMASGTVTAEIPAESGIYRVCFSLAEDSRNDDVYYTFIVK